MSSNSMPRRPLLRDLLQVPHLHITLTTDDLLWPYFLDDRSRLKTILKTGAQVIREVVDELYPGVRVGKVYTVHSYSRDPGFKPHVHLVMTKGGLQDGEWVKIDSIPAARLAARWRYLLCKHLRQACPHDPALRRAIDQGYRDHRGYQVHTDSFYPEGLETARYIGRYLGHPPIFDHFSTRAVRARDLVWVSGAPFITTCPTIIANLTPQM